MKSLASVFLVKNSASTAKLRLLLVEPTARGNGIGGRLIDECVQFRGRVGYRKDHALDQSRACSRPGRSTKRLAFGSSKRNAHDLFGEGLIGQTWELRHFHLSHRAVRRRRAFASRRGERG